MTACQRVLIAMVIVLSVVVVVLAVFIAWRELREEGKEEKAEINKENLHKYYPTNFRTDAQQELYSNRFINGFNNRTVVTTFVKPINGTCQYQCFDREQPARRKRAAQSAGANHGCCISTVKFVSPVIKSNIFGRNRSLVQLDDAKQYFGEHECRAVQSCFGCVCSQENNLHTAIVIKTTVNPPSDAEYIEDTEIDFFLFKGCCKCINT